MARIFTSEEMKETIRTMYKQGIHIAEISRRTKVTETTTSYICKSIRRENSRYRVDGMQNEYEIRGLVTVVYIKKKTGEIYECLIDTVDLPKMKIHNGTWCAFPDKTASREKVYVMAMMNVGSAKSRRSVQLHRWLMGEPKDMYIDHINGQTLDNRRSVNLRIVTAAENQQNRIHLQKNNTSGVRGVRWVEKEKKWTAIVTINKVHIRVGTFDNKQEATEAVIIARTQMMPYSQEALRNSESA